MHPNDYTDCVAIWPDGRRKKASIRILRLDSPEQAMRKLARGVVAWVAPEDAERVTNDKTQMDII